MSIIKNASPQFIALGTDDKSIRQVLPEPEAYPQHLPLFFIFAKKGTTERLLLSANNFTATYGSGAFEPKEKFFNHATRFLRDIAGTGNSCIVQRVVPTDAGVRANATIWIDILETMLPNYVRTSNGDYIAVDEINSYKLDPDRPYIKGYKIKFIKEYNTVSEPKVGLEKPRTGTMIDADSGEQSMMYPFLEIRAKYQGEYYNNIGFSIESLFGDEVDANNLAYNKTMPYKLALYTRKDASSSPDVLRSLYGEPSVEFAFQPHSRPEPVLNLNSDLRYDLEYVFSQNWFNETDELKPIVYNDYAEFYFYKEYYEEVLTKVARLEREFVSVNEKVWADGEEAPTISWYDFTTDDPEEILAESLVINPFTCKTSKNVKLHCLAPSNVASDFAKGQSEVTISDSTPVFLSGGSDGSCTLDMFEKLVIKEMDKYVDENSEVMDLAINVESIFYDSGFSLDTKKELISFISLRKDTILILNTHDAGLGEKYKPLSDQRGVAVALKNRLKLAPESVYYGTPCARGMIFAGTGVLRDGSTLDRIPLNYELGLKAGRMMGAGNAEWKMEFLFDKQPGNVLDYLVDIQPKFIPQGVKPTLWNAGIVWAQPKDRINFHFPALQTVYDNDTSVLNSFFTIMAVSYCTKIAHETWRMFTGAVGMSNGVFINEVTNYARKRLQNKFGSIITVEPTVEITEEDELRGYSWHMNFKLYAYNMKTVAVYTTTTYRQGDDGTAN